MAETSAFPSQMFRFQRANLNSCFWLQKFSNGDLAISLRQAKSILEPYITPAQSFGIEFWRLIVVGDATPSLFKEVPIDPDYYYRLTTKWAGDGVSLDILGDNENNNKPQLAISGQFSGQYWRFVPLANNFYQVSCRWRGVEMPLTT